MVSRCAFTKRDDLSSFIYNFSLGSDPFVRARLLLGKFVDGDIGIPVMGYIVYMGTMRDLGIGLGIKKTEGISQCYESQNRDNYDK